MKNAILAVLLLLAADPAHAEMWRYTTPDGGVHFTDDPGTIPPKARATARRHAPLAEQSAQGAGDQETALRALKAERLRIIEGFSERQARIALERGLLTEEEVGFLVNKGSLRLTDLGDAYRFAGKPQAAPSGGPAAAVDPTAPMTLEQRDTKMLQELAASYGQRAEAVGQVEQETKKSFTDNPKFKWALIGQGVFVALLIVTYPFVLRRYNDDGTRRIIRMSFLFIFIIVSSTGHLLLFKDDVASVISMKKGARAPGAITPEAARVQPPSNDMPAKRPWDNNRK